MSLTSCRALSSWGCRSPFPAGVGRRGRAGDAGLVGCTHGLGPCGGVFGCGVGDKGAREHGADLRLVEGLVPPEQAEKTHGQTDTHSDTKLHSHLGSGVS